MSHQINALIISRFVRPLLQRGPLKARVLSIHERACNLATDEGEIVALVTPSLGAGPFHIMMGEELSFRSLVRPRASAWLTPEVVEIGSSRVSLSSAQVWDPTPHWPEPDGNTDLLLRVLRPLLLASSVNSLSHLIRSHIESGLEDLVVGVREHASEQMARGVSRLIGLGPGLTPAGDDVILGVLAALHARDDRTAQDLLFPTVAQALSHTTELSALWLKHALMGHFPQHWHELAQAWKMQDENALFRTARHILHIGATSGFYALLGFYRSLRLQE